MGTGNDEDDQGKGFFSFLKKKTGLVVDPCADDPSPPGGAGAMELVGTHDAADSVAVGKALEGGGRWSAGGVPAPAPKVPVTNQPLKARIPTSGNAASGVTISSQYMTTARVSSGSWAGALNFSSSSSLSVECIDPLGVYRLGDVCDAVELINRALVVRQALVAVPSDPKEFTEATRSAVKAFQKIKGIPVDGVVRARTLLALGLVTREQLETASAVVDAECVQSGHEIVVPSTVTPDRVLSYTCTRCGAGVFLRPDGPVYGEVLLSYVVRANQIRSQAQVDGMTSPLRERAIALLSEFKAVSGLVDGDLQKSQDALMATEVAIEMLTKLVIDE